MRVVRAAMPAPAVLAAAAVLALHEHIRVQAAEPARRRGRGRAHNDADARLAQLVHHFVEKRKIEFPVPGLHAVPGEFANARHIDANLPHAANVAVQLLLRPVLRIIRHAQIGRFCHETHSRRLLSRIARFFHAIVPRTRGKRKRFGKFSGKRCSIAFFPDTKPWTARRFYSIMELLTIWIIL